MPVIQKQRSKKPLSGNSLLEAQEEELSAADGICLVRKIILMFETGVLV